MLDTLKDLWSKWKVHITVAGGVVAVATAYGTCTYEPPTVSEATVVPAESSTPTAPATVEVSSTTHNTESAETTTTTE
jgi:hypothetical protein